MLNTIFTTTIYNNKFQVFSFKCHVFVTKGFCTNIYTLPPRKVPFYVQNLVFILLMIVASRFGLVFVWTVSLLMVALVLFVFKRSKSYSLLTVLVITVLVVDKRTFAPLNLVSRPGINSVNSPNFYCNLGNLST